MKNKARLEPFLKVVVDTTQEFIDAIADDDNHDDLSEDANDYLDFIKKQWEQSVIRGRN